MSDPLELIIGHIYRAKRPRFNNYREYNDRHIAYIDQTKVQYDSSTVRTEQRYPTIDREQFEKWAGEDVTEGYPSDGWEVKE